jgi:hypothetical protein
MRIQRYSLPFLYSKNIWNNNKVTKADVKKLQKAFQNITCGDYYDTPLIAKLLEVKKDEDDKVKSFLNFFLKQGMNINEQ